MISGLIFTIIAYTPFVRVLDKSIPKNLKEGITIGIGLFMAFVGLQNSKIIIPNKQNVVELNHINIYSDLAILLLLFAIVIFTLGTKLAFFYTVIIGTIVSFLAGIIKVKYHFYDFSLRSIVSENNIFSYSFDKIGQSSFSHLKWMANIYLNSFSNTTSYN
ncbi:solute carrier family 23 protein [Staphylococcus epidermidis]|uniref:solute carrier family 23 protein n=1 Tax=Staphylococcus epidermidis TaxID=1282 RepID=UPI0033BA89FC